LTVKAGFGGEPRLYSLLSEPETFQRYVLGSPSIWWHDDVIFDLESAYARSPSHHSLIVETLTCSSLSDPPRSRNRPPALAVGCGRSRLRACTCSGDLAAGQLALRLPGQAMGHNTPARHD